MNGPSIHTIAQATYDNNLTMLIKLDLTTLLMCKQWPREYAVYYS